MDLIEFCPYRVIPVISAINMSHFAGEFTREIRSAGLPGRYTSEL